MDLRPPDPPLSDGVVTLVPFSDAHVDAVCAACQDEWIQRFIPIPRPYTRADAEDYVARTRRDWEAGTKAAFAVVDAHDPSVLLGAINVAIAGAAGNSGYWVAPAARGRRVATRALRLVADWALTRLGLGVVILEIRPENTRSQRVAEAAGFHRAGTIDVNDVTGEQGGLIYSRLASDRNGTGGRR